MGIIQGVLLDIDGVLHVGGEPVEGAAETLAFLDNNEIRYRCISNSTRRSRRTLSDMLGTMGITIPTEHIFTPAIAAIRILNEKKLKSPYLLVTDNVEKDFENAGFYHNDKEADSVIIGDAGDDFTYESLNLAFQLLLNGATGIALEKDRYWRDTDGLSLSAGPFVTGLEYAVGVECILAGKPSHKFFSGALQSMCLSPDDVIMVGDDIRTDIGGGQESGIKGVLVKTGKFSPESLEKSYIIPDHMIESIANLPDLF